MDPLTGLPKESKPHKSASRGPRFSTLSPTRRSSSSSEKKSRNRQSVNVSEMLAKANESGSTPGTHLDKDFDDLAALIAAEELEKTRQTIKEEPEVSPKETKTDPKKPSPRTRLLIDPNDIDAQLALEESSRKKKTDGVDLVQAEADMLRKMGSLMGKGQPASPSVASGRDSCDAFSSTLSECLFSLILLTSCRSRESKTGTTDAPVPDDPNSKQSRGSKEMKPKAAPVIAVDPNDPRKDLPYFPVILALDRLNTAASPIDKLECLATAGQGILKCVDEWNTNKSEQIVMGAEDKFPVSFLSHVFRFLLSSV